MPPDLEPMTAYGEAEDELPRAPSAMVEAPTMLPMPPPAPQRTSDAERAARTGAGVGLLFAVTGTGVGFWFGGPMGAGAGLLLVGAARNTVRATRGWTDPNPVVRQDAGTSASLALFGSLLGGYLAYRAYQRDRGEDS